VAQPSHWRRARCTSATPDELRELWDEIVRQVADDAGLALGVHLDAPEHVTGETEADPAVSAALASSRAVPVNSVWVQPCPLAGRHRLAPSSSASPANREQRRRTFPRLPAAGRLDARPWSGERGPRPGLAYT